MDFIKDIQDINILSNPQIMTLDHSEAEVFVGENIPYQTSEKFDNNNNPIVTYDYRDVGVKLKLTLHINKKDNLVRLEVDQEINKVVSLNDDKPTTLKRNTKTKVQLMDGSTMVIAGLIEEYTTKGKRGMPGVSSIPLLGWLFKTEDIDISKTTIMIFITSRIIHTLDTAQAITREKQRILEEEKIKTRQLYEDEFSIYTSTEEEDVPAAPPAAPAQKPTDSTP